MDAAVQVRVMLASAREEDVPFDSIWYTIHRTLAPPPDCPPDLVADYEVERIALRETKPHWRAAYERRLPTEAELEAGMRHARRRLRDLLLSEAEEVAEREAVGSSASA